MKVPLENHNRSLVLVDIQPPFLNDNTSKILDKVLLLLNSVDYKFYARIFFHCQKGSIWEKQQNYVLPNRNQLPVDCKIHDYLKTKNNAIIEKETKSAFKGNPSLLKLLKQNDISEVHIVGLDTYDCVLATALESFDLGFLTYVLEECCQSNSGELLNDSAINILRDLKMTNESSISTNKFKDI